MKFTCESCSAQYMISDEKVGPSGVKVRCKKCGNVIFVRRAGPAAGAPQPEAPAAAAPAPGLDAELGAAFDQAFGDTPPSTAAPAAGKDLGATQAMGSEDAAKISAAAAPAQTEWYVAIGQAQVGPLPLAEVKRKWEAGDVGPDSLVWRPGMGDWAPLSTIQDLAGYLAPIPRAAPRRAPEPAPAPRREAEAPAAGPASPAAEPTWKPVGASALAALANEELANRSAPAQRPSPRPSPGGVKSLVDGLPDGGGVDPTGALPLSIKALERTDEKKIEPRTSVARGAAQARSRRSASRALGVVAGLLVVGGAAAGGFFYWQRTQQGPAGAEAAVPAAPVPAAASAPAPAPAPPAVAAAEPPPPAQPEPKPEPTPEAKAEPRAETAAPAPAKAAKPPPPPPRETKRETRTAAAAPAPSPAKKGGSLLDFESNDAALDAALGGGSTPSGRSVYVPPAAGGGLPDKVSPGDINAAVAQRIDALRKCVSEQKTREPDASGTLKMRWVIQGDGSVRDVKSLTPEYAQGAFAACISGVVKSIRFPRSTTAGQEVVFPFNF